MKIIVLDGFTLNPGDLDWQEFYALGDAVIYDRTPKELIVERGKDADILITNKCPITREVIDSLPKLRYVGVLATGYNVIDTAYCAQKGIVVTNIPAYSTESVAQTAFGLIIECFSLIGAHSREVKEGKWAESEDFCRYNPGIRELFGKTLGIVGYGRIGRRIADIGRAFGLKIAVYNKGNQYPGVDCKETMEELLSAADIVSLNCPLTADNQKMINERTISFMKKGAVLINTARGGLVDEKALADALNSGYLGGAGLDVLSTEPPSPDNPLLSAKNTVITPHIGWATKEARARLMKIAADNLKEFLRGNTVNRVN